MQRYGSTSMRPKGAWSSSGIQNMHASMGQYSMQAGEPAQPVQQSVVMARMRGLFLRVALPSPSDMGQYFSTMSNTCYSSIHFQIIDKTLTTDPVATACGSDHRYLSTGYRLAQRL